MFRHLILVAGLATLSACGDPLSGVERIDEVDLAQADTAAALPTEEEVAREGFFGTAAAEGDVPSAVPTAETTVPETDVVVPEAAAQPQTRTGRLLGFLRRGGDKADAAPATETPAKVTATDSQADAVAQAVAESAADVAPAPVADAQATQVAALTPEPATATDAATAEAVTPVPLASPTPKRRGLFARNARKAAAKAPRTGPDARDVEYGATLPYGVIARSCPARGRPLGRKVEKADARGFALYDSDPGAKGGRTWYLTGFGDGCPRQFTAANALIGSAALYETLHYGPGGKNLPVGETDKAYSKVKRKVCGTRKGKPCGAKIGKMNKTTFFVTAYERFGNSSRWYEVIVHDGEVLAAVIKPNG